MFHTLLSRCTLSAAQCSRNLTLIRQFSSNIDFDKLVNNHKVVVFMKGVPGLPRCGFSSAVIQVLNHYGVEFESHDVLSSRDLREGIKKYSDWPTIPQIFVNGKFIGGSDILLEMHNKGEINKFFEDAGIKAISRSSNQEKNSEKKTGKK